MQSSWQNNPNAFDRLLRDYEKGLEAERRAEFQRNSHNTLTHPPQTIENVDYSQRTLDTTYTETTQHVTIEDLSHNLRQEAGKTFKPKLLNILGNFAPTKGIGSRVYDYEEIYPEDIPGQETAPDARVFKVYNDEAGKYDEDLIRTFKDTLDTLLIFAALFSAVVTAFVIQTTQLLQTDQSQVTNYLLMEQIQLIRAMENVTTVLNTPASPYGPESQMYKSIDVWINGLFFTSLALSLATALLSVLAKQWLQAYMGVISGSARDVALIRHLRFSGLEKWRVPEIVGALPLVLHASLAVFSAGLGLYTYVLSQTLAWIIISISSAAFLLYLGSVILAAVDISCPYRIAALYPFSMFLVASVTRMTMFICSLFTRKKGTNYITSPFFWSIKDAEKSRVEESTGSGSLLIHSTILWLHKTSSNISVRRIAANSIGGSHFSYSPLNGPFAQTYYDAILESWNVHNEKPAEAVGVPILHMAAKAGHTQIVRRLVNMGEDINEIKDNFGSPLQTAAAHGHLETVRVLLRQGATTQLQGGYWGSALTAAALNDNLEIATLLMDNGAQPNDMVPLGYGWSPLSAASSRGHKEMVELLLDRGADPNNLNNPDGQSPLVLAARSGHVDVMRCLLKRGAFVNLEHEGISAVIRSAVGVEDWVVVELLLDNARLRSRRERARHPDRGRFQSYDPRVSSSHGQ